MINIVVVIQNYSFNSSKDVILAIGIFFIKIYNTRVNLKVTNMIEPLNKLNGCRFFLKKKIKRGLSLSLSL